MGIPDTVTAGMGTAVMDTGDSDTVATLRTARRITRIGQRIRTGLPQE
jgi:hypothetical protein